MKKKTGRPKKQPLALVMAEWRKNLLHGYAEHMEQIKNGAFTAGGETLPSNWTAVCNRWREVYVREYAGNDLQNATLYKEACERSQDDRSRGRKDETARAAAKRVVAKEFGITERRVEQILKGGRAAGRLVAEYQKDYFANKSAVLLLDPRYADLRGLKHSIEAAFDRAHEGLLAAELELKKLKAR